MSKGVAFLKDHETLLSTGFEEKARWRKENKVWLNWSRNIALSLIGYMEDNGLTRADLARRLGVSPQYVSKILSGKINFSFRSIAEMEDKLDLHLMNVVQPA